MRGLVLLLWFAAPAAAGELTLGSLFQDGAVVQHGREIPVWGTAEPGERVAVSYLDASATTETDAQGNWRVALGPFGPGRTGELRAQGVRETLTRREIVTGDVWLCSGQSNMQLPLRMTANAEREIAAASHPEIHVFKVSIQVAKVPASRIGGEWRSCSPQTAGDISAAAYYFAREVVARTHVPIGLIVSAKGGAPVEAFLPPEVLTTHPQASELRERWAASLKKWKPPTPKTGLPPVEPGESAMQPLGPEGFGEPGVLYNGMIAPLVPYAVRGAIWYQGEANTSTGFVQPAQYGEWFRTMIGSWRTKWGSEFPFYFVQLPANNMKARDFTGHQWTTLREQQATALSLPGTGMVVTIDLGEPDNIHPTNKAPVGHRLALLALKRTYGSDVGEEQSPALAQVSREGGRLRLTFEHAENLRTRDGESPRGFEVRGADGPYRPAVATLEAGAVVIWSDEIMEPMGVRYAWKQDPGDANLENEAGLPISPFRREAVE